MEFSADDLRRFREKFLAKAPDECWPWLAALTVKRKSYGAFGLGRKVVRAHRAAYAISVGPIPAGVDVMHTCDNPRCVNPKHLVVGTRAANNEDMRGKGRSARKLDAEKVRYIRTSPLSSRALARELGVSQHMVMRVLHRKAWAHIT